MENQTTKTLPTKLEPFSSCEHQLIVEAPAKYGEFYEHAQFAIDLLDSWIASAKYEAVYFMMFFSLVKKHIVLATLSSLRLHHVQANFDMRYSIEAGAWAAFAIGNPKPELFGTQTEQGFDPDKKTKKKMYDWLTQHYPEGSAQLERFKSAFNMLSAHANVADAGRNFIGMTREKIHTSLFDEPLDYRVQSDLWAAANLVMGLLDIFYGVNRDHNLLTFEDDFLSKLGTLRDQNKKLKDEALSHPNFQQYATAAQQI